jgi:hypothetical protein
LRSDPKSAELVFSNVSTVLSDAGTATMYRRSRSKDEPVVELILRGLAPA